MRKCADGWVAAQTPAGAARCGAIVWGYAANPGEISGAHCSPRARALHRAPAWPTHPLCPGTPAATAWDTRRTCVDCPCRGSRRPTAPSAASGPIPAARRPSPRARGLHPHRLARAHTIAAARRAARARARPARRSGAPLSRPRAARRGRPARAARPCTHPRTWTEPRHRARPCSRQASPQRPPALPPPGVSIARRGALREGRSSANCGSASRDVVSRAEREEMTACACVEATGVERRREFRKSGRAAA